MLPAIWEPAKLCRNSHRVGAEPPAGQGTTQHGTGWELRSCLGEQATTD